MLEILEFIKGQQEGIFVLPEFALNIHTHDTSPIVELTKSGARAIVTGVLADPEYLLAYTITNGEIIRRHDYNDYHPVFIKGSKFDSLTRVCREIDPKYEILLKDYDFLFHPSAPMLETLIYLGESTFQEILGLLPNRTTIVSASYNRPSIVKPDGTFILGEELILPGVYLASCEFEL